MFAEKAFELIKELQRNPDNLPVFNVSLESINLPTLQNLK